MTWADAQPAFASGAVDGQENPMSIFTAAKLQNVGQKNVTMWGYVADPLVSSWSTRTSGIPGRRPTRRSCVKPPSKPASSRSPSPARALDEPGQPLLKEIAALGVTVTQLSPAERDAFVKATRPVYEKWKKAGVELVAQAEKSIAARKK